MNFIEDLKTKVFCRLKPSPIHGVGVFAIRAIPKGINPMEETRPVDFVEVPTEDFKQLTKEPALLQLVKDFCPENPASMVFDCPSVSLNEMGISWYLNHSDTPNMEEDDGYFFAMRDIAPGEELTVDYGTYGKLNL